MISEQLKSCIRPVYHAIRTLLFYPKAKRILRAYDAHYREAQRVYRNQHPPAPLEIAALTEVKVRMYEPGRATPLLTLSDRYVALVEQVCDGVQRQLARSANCLFFPKIDSAGLPDRLEDVPAVRNSEIIAVQLKDYRLVQGLEELCRLVLPEIERKVYGTHLVVDKVYIYRNLPSRTPEQVSWMWHYDNHPSQIKKIMVYLTDVSEETGPFEFLSSGSNGEGVYMSPTPLSGYGRISPARIRQWEKKGCRPQKVVGSKGTLLFFDENVVHKANVASRGHRDVVVFQIRPAAFRPDSYLDPRWTGSFQHVDFSPDPYDHQPKLKPHMLSA